MTFKIGVYIMVLITFFNTLSFATDTYDLASIKQAVKENIAVQETNSQMSDIPFEKVESVVYQKNEPIAKDKEESNTLKYILITLGAIALVGGVAAVAGGSGGGGGSSGSSTSTSPVVVGW